MTLSHAPVHEDPDMAPARLVTPPMPNGKTNGVHRDNLCAVLHGAGDLRMEVQTLSPPQDGEVTVKVAVTGLCGSDLHYYCHGRNGNFALQHPMCLGHESVGEVVQMTPLAMESRRDLFVGAKVAIEPGQNCEQCSFCLSGRYNLCNGMRFASSAKTAPHLNGTLQQYINWPARLLHLLPGTSNLQTAALAEPLSVVLQAFKRSRFTAGQSVLVIGTGAVGLLTCAAARHFEALQICAVDVDDKRLQTAKTLGWADQTFNSMKSGQTEAADQASAILAAASAKGGFDVVYECTGIPACVSTAIHAAKAGGVVCLIGMGHPTMTLPLGAAALREVDIVGVFRYANVFPQAVSMLCESSLKDSVGGMISHTFPLAETDAAFEAMRKGKGVDGVSVIKAMILHD